LALCAVGNISSSGIARDLAPEVEKLLGVNNPYIKKKVNYNMQVFTCIRLLCVQSGFFVNVQI
jgi:hypothetical protein